MISAATHLFRLARAGFVFAREGVLGLVDPEPLPPPARLGVKLARLFERPGGGGSSVRLTTTRPARRTLRPAHARVPEDFLSLLR